MILTFWRLEPNRKDEERDVVVDPFTKAVAVAALMMTTITADLSRLDLALVSFKGFSTIIC